MTEETSNLLRVWCINPIHQTEIKYYFCVVDLPIADTKPTFSCSYDNESNVLNYTFSDMEVGDPTALTTYKLPVFLEQYYEKDVDQPVVINSVSISGMVNGKPVQSTGDSSSIKHSGLDELLDNYPSFGVNEIRTVFAISQTFPNLYFLIIFVKTEVGKDKLLKVEVDSDGVTLVCSFNDNNNPITDSDHVVAAHMVECTYGMYSKIKIEGGAESVLNYPVLI